MKVNILYDEPQGFLGGYLNLDPKATIDDPHKRTPCQLGQLDQYVCPAEASVIRAIHALDMCEDRKVLRHWVTLLGQKGTLIVGGLDIGLLAHYYTTGRISEEDYLAQIYARKSASTWNTTCKTLIGLGLEIVQNKANGLYYCITARKKAMELS